MGISVGAALKKITVALVSDKKTLKNMAMAALVIIVALLMPMAAIMQSKTNPAAFFLILLPSFYYFHSFSIYHTLVSNKALLNF